MNFLILDPEDIISSVKFKIRRPVTVEHIQNVLNKKEGDSVKAAVSNQALGLFRIQSIDNDRNEIIGKFVPILVPKRRIPEIHLLIAVQRPPTVEKILQLAGTWGVASMEFLLADLSRKEYLTSPVWRKESLDKNLLLGMEQGGNIYKPEIKLGFTLPGKNLGFTKKENFKDRVGISPLPFFYLDKKGKYLSENSSFFSPTSKTFTVLLGPEAGWTKSELLVFQNQGLKAIRLSGSVLRSEQAMAFFLAQLESQISSKNTF